MNEVEEKATVAPVATKPVAKAHAPNWHRHGTKADNVVPKMKATKFGVDANDSGPTAAVCGYTASCSLGGTISHIRLNITQEVAETTNMSGTGWKTYVQTVYDSSGSFDSYTGCGNVGASAALNIDCGLGTWTMDVIITSISVDDSVKDAVKFVYNFVQANAIS